MISMNAVYYAASTMPLGDSTVTSGTTLFVPQWDDLQSAPNDVVCFIGTATDLDEDIRSVNGGGGMNCTASNGCGVHIHAGTSCEDKESQGKFVPCYCVCVCVCVCVCYYEVGF